METIMEKEERPMFFGKKLKELRLKSRKGLRNFSIEIGVDPSFLSEIERGLQKLEDFERYDAIKEQFNEKVTEEDIAALDELFQAPFIMQRMTEGIMISPLTHKSDGTRLTKEEFTNLANHVNDIAIEHNKKADAYNKAHGV